VAPIVLQLLGAPGWRVAGGPRRALPRKDAALLARLALDGPTPRSVMAAWLWADVPLPRAHANLRQRLYKLRQAAPAALVEEAGELLSLGASVQADLRREVCAPEASWEAVLLAGADAADAAGAADAVQAWLDDARRQWLARRPDLVTGLAAACEARGELAAALALTERLLALDPLLEHAWRRLMRLHAQRGDRAAALAAFERCEQVLRDELGVRPSAETQTLLHRVESGERLSAAAAPAPRADLADASPAEPRPVSKLLRPQRLVGRLLEAQAMQQAWAAGQAFLLVGEAGLGKTRLLLELAAAGPNRVIEAARAGDETVSYRALVRLLRSMVRVAPRPQALWPAGAAGEAERLELARLLPELGPTPAAPGMEVLLHHALEQVFARAPAAGLQVVLFDDLHHADEASRAVLYRASAQPGLLWGLASRPDAAGDIGRWLGSSARVQPVRLQGLDEAAVADLLADCAAPGQDPATLAPELARHCGGNPLFLLETLRALALQADPGQQPPGAVLPLPPSVENLLAQRLAALPEAALALARVAAIAGPDFNAEVAADVLERDLFGLAEPLAALEAQQVLRDDRFVHDTLHETTLRQIPQALRRPLHARVARSLQRRGAPAWRVASHFDAGGLPAEAAPMAVAAAADARRLGRLAERVARLEDAVRWYQAAGAADDEREARTELIHALFAAEGPTPAVLGMTDELLAGCTQREQRVLLQLLRAGLSLSTFDVASARVAASGALAEAAPDSDQALSARLLLAAGQAHAGESAQAALAVQGLTPRLRACTDALLATDLWGYLAMVHAHSGQLDACIEALHMQRQLARQVGKADDEADALTSLTGQYAQRGDLALAQAVGLEAVAMHRRMGARHGLAGALLNLAMTQFSLHLLRDALATLAEVRVTLANIEGLEELRCVSNDGEADLWLRAGQPAKALALVAEDALQGVSMPRAIGRLTQRARALQALGDREAAAALWRRVLQTPVGPPRLLRAQTLAVLGLRGEADAQGPALVELLARQAPALQVLGLWLQGAVAQRRGDGAAALAAARSLRERIARGASMSLPEAEARAWLLQALQALAPADEAEAARAEAWRWWHEVLVPGLPEGCAPPFLLQPPGSV
jgi:DNA-binding SARP family transcriptional activator